MTTSCTTKSWYPSRLSYNQDGVTKETIKWVDANKNSVPKYVVTDLAQCKRDATIANRTNNTDKPVTKTVEHWYSSTVEFLIGIGSSIVSGFKALFGLLV